MDDDMNSPHNWEKFPQRIQTQLSEKGKTISGIFIAFLKSTENFLYLEEKDHLHSLNIFKVLDSKKCSYLNAKTQLFDNNLPE